MSSPEMPSSAESPRRKLEQAVGVGEGASDEIIYSGFMAQDSDGQEYLLAEHPELEAIVEKAEKK
jgi:hypothetical protein